ncbi:glycosyltransferase family 2 protein [Kingella negevensis]|uniref:glycosyltransferase family 2 protein n=1 Tax=Kingella negevensis TaxID=1522312 RepID=UPI00050A039A|nr:glycosyltransferase family 2 protein [Kingella negevensis]MDK4689032.1 glycosyltransferase family 2 protein [Kingella negevensis]WII90619.1 glycosyltransferase family 2 protein [Kingella negevensis]WII93658.1 glycosyltransferase family 2 protein [Kingella negevensis]
MKISLIIPVWNEAETIPIFYQTVREYTPLQDYEVELVFCNDGSRDETEQILNDLAAQDTLVNVLHFTRNFGKEAALFAGLEHATGDALIPIDVDLQDPIEVIPQMIEKWRAGADIVLAKRIDRSQDSPMKRLSATAFYKAHNYMSNTHIEENVGDFRLISREIADSIISLPERNLFMKGILSWASNNIAIVEYSRPARVAGETKFNGWKLWNLALEGITSFSTVPLRVWTYIGGILAGTSFLYGLFIIVRTLFFGNDVKGYPSLLVSILFLGGIQLISIGVLGEYIGRIYIETKQRPRYVLKKIKK